MSTAQKILVADDSLTIRKLVENVLCQEGYEVVTAETGADCLALAAAQKPNLILLDYILPDKQGTEICRELINSPETWEIPVLMMSSNGNAIRQLYQDLNNVSDYLTKPFAPSVLTAVVGHLLQREKRGAAGETAATATAGAGAASVSAESKPAVPAEFMDKVSRLLELIENRPPVEETAAAVPPPPKSPRRVRKSAVAIPPPEALLRKVRAGVQKHLRARMRQFPDWESREAEQFFLDRVLTREMICDLAGDLVRASGMPAEAPGAVRTSAALVPLDTLLRHLHTHRATGELRVETAQETVGVLLQLGEIVFLTTNNPRNYCAGAACDFQSVPHAIIGEAVRAQEEQHVPFFISLQQAGHLPPGAALDGLLRSQGRKCLVRAFKFADATLSFFPLNRLPAVVRNYKLDTPFVQWLLVCYRSVDDWFTLEQLFTEMEAAFVPVPEADDFRRRLQLEPDEERVLAAVASGRTVSEVAAASGLIPFEICRILFRFIKLGLLRTGLRREHDQRIDEQSVNRCAAPSTAAAPDLASSTAVVPDSGLGTHPSGAPAVTPESATPPDALPSESPAAAAGASSAPVAGVNPTPSPEMDGDEPALAVPAPQSFLASSDGGSSSPQSPTVVSSRSEPAISVA